ncbi:MAG: zf-HC2 domain-containing protein [Myxococcota bacterium]
MLTCKEMTELCTDYLERRMGTWDRIRFGFHLALCKHCREYINQMQATVDSLGYMPEDALPSDVESALLQHFKDWKQAN